MKFVTSYWHNGARYNLIIDADNWEDAQARCAKLGLTLDGELVFRVPHQAGWLARAICAVRNFFHT